MVPHEWHVERQFLLRRVQSLECDPAALSNAIDDYLDSEHAKAVVADKIDVAGIDVDPLAVSVLDLRRLPRRMRTGRCFWIPKSDGSRRLACSLSAPLRVALGMAKDIKVRTHRPADHIGDWPGRGPQYSVRRLAGDLPNAQVVMLADVVNCFPTANPEHAWRLGSPISDLVEASIHPRRVRLCGPSGTNPSLLSDTQSRTGPPGLLRAGPAANVLWAMMIDDLPGSLPEGVRAHTYADNIAIACHSTQEADAVEAALIRYFTDHPAGPFTLKTERVDVELGFDHLGYDICTFDETVHVGVSDRNLDNLACRIEREVHNCGYPLTEANIERVTAACCSPWPALSTSGRDEIREEVLIAAQHPR